MYKVLLDYLDVMAYRALTVFLDRRYGLTQMELYLSLVPVSRVKMAELDSPDCQVCSYNSVNLCKTVIFPFRRAGCER